MVLGSDLVLWACGQITTELSPPISGKELQHNSDTTKYCLNSENTSTARLQVIESKDLASDVQILVQKHKKYEKTSTVVPLKVNNSTIMDTNDSEWRKSQRIQKNDYKNDQQN
jgi:hypothetical protein